MNQTIFRCVNCATQFSRENLLRNIGESSFVSRPDIHEPSFSFIYLENVEVKCPECNSTYVVEIKESSPPRPLKHQRPLEKSESHSSIGELIFLFSAFSFGILWCELIYLRSILWKALVCKREWMKCWPSEGNLSEDISSFVGFALT